MIGEHASERHRVFHGELCAGTDAEVRSVRGVADQNDIFVMPLLAEDAGKFEPDRRACEMLRVGDEGIAVEAFGEELFAERDRLLRFHLVDARGEPVGFGSFDDESGPVFVETVGVEIEPAPWRFSEIEGEGIELLSCAEPDEAILSDLNVGLEDGFVLAAGDRRRAVGGDEKIAVGGEVIGIGDFFLED